MTLQPYTSGRHPDLTPREVRQAEGLRELHQVAEAHARCRRAYAIQALVLGPCLVAGALADPRAARALFLAAPAVLLLAAWASARVFRAPEGGPSTRWATIAFFTFAGAFMLFDLSRATWYRAVLSREAALAAGAAALLLGMAAAFRLSQRGPEVSQVIIAMVPASRAIPDHLESEVGFWGALGAYLVGLGLWRLARLGFLTWRLRALRRALR
jgi:hypothetical protein